MKVEVSGNTNRAAEEGLTKLLKRRGEVAGHMASILRRVQTSTCGPSIRAVLQEWHDKGYVDYTVDTDVQPHRYHAVPTELGRSALKLQRK